MSFALGYITGLLTCVLVFAIVAATKGTHRFLDRAENVAREGAKKLDDKLGGGVLPIERGFVEFPPDDDELARQDIIESNRAAGKSTRISELQ